MQVTRVAIRRPVTVSMAVAAVALFGYVSVQRLPVNLLPEISYPSLTVQTDYEDAAPEEVETLLTRPVEEAVGVVSGLNRITSVSRPGQSEVVLEFNWSTDMDVAGVDVREKLDLIEFPRDAGRPVILRFDPSNDPILRIQVHGTLTPARLRDVAEREFKKRIESVEGVAAVKVVGGREEQIRVEIDERLASELGIPITRVTEILRQENLNQASGSLYDLDMNYMVRMVNEFRSVEDVRGIVVSEQDGRRILVGDVARVWRGSRDRDILARFNGQASVEMAVFKEGDANTVTVSGAVEDRLTALRSEPTFPEGVATTIVFDQARFIRSSVNNVLAAAAAGGVLATLVLFVFLRDGRSTGIIAVSIPISVMATFAAMHQAGITLNIMSLGGVALGVGMLVDNSIVVLEAVHRHRGVGGDLAAAVHRGASEVAMPVTASTLTTVAVFLPLVFVEGIAGQLFRDQALTITFSLLASLGVALTVIPMLLSARLRPPEAGTSTSALRAAGRHGGRLPSWIAGAARFAAVQAPAVLAADLRRVLRTGGASAMRGLQPLLTRFDRVFDQVSAGYSAVLRAALDHRAVAFAAVLSAVAAAGLASMHLGGELIPPLTQGEFSFQLALPEGRPLEATDRVMRRVEAEAIDIPGVEAVVATVGGSQDSQFATSELEEHVGALHVLLEDPDDWRAEERVIDRIRQVVSELPEVEPTLGRPALFTFKTPVEVEVFAFDLMDQQRAADLVAERLASVEGLRDIETTMRPGSPEIQVRFDRRRLNRLGLEEQQVARVLRNKIRGDVASRFREGDRLIDILVRVDESGRDAISDVGQLVVNSDARREAGSRGRRPEESALSGQAARQLDRGSAAQPGADAAQDPQPPFVPIRLNQVAEVSVERGPAEIRRIRSQRAAVVRANLSGRDLGSATAEIRAALEDLRPRLPVSATVAVGGQNEELEVSFRSLGFAMALAVFLVYLVMASQFESLLHPFVILLTVPLGLVGVVLMLTLTGGTLNVVALLGAIVLAGIAVNNGIVLVDYVNRLRAGGLDKRESILEAGRVRLRPILMTSLTTLLGLVPMAFGWGEGDALRMPMAVAVIGGLLAATPATLIVIPLVYDLVDRKRSFLPGPRFAPSSGSGPTRGGAMHPEQA